MSEMWYVDGGVVAPEGFLCSGVAAGVKKSGKRDLALLVAEAGAVPAAAVFTRNTMAAPPVHVSRRNVEPGRIRALVVNSGNANACTGERGAADAEAMCAAVAEALGCAAAEVLVASTGVIGVPLPVGDILAAVPDGIEALDNSSGDDAVEAIMTTDTFPKQTAIACEVEGRRYAVGGMAKGSGMIEPNMATMLAFLTTDAPLTPDAADAALRAAVDRTFNRITVDGDTSTNDMCSLMASGAAGGDGIGPGGPSFATVAAAIEEVCRELARMIVRDGEGATKLVEVTVRGAASDADAEAAAREIADSPLVKTAIFGADANWGRVVMALGNSGAQVDPARVEVLFGGIVTCREGMAVPFDEEAALAALSADQVAVDVDLHLGDGAATMLTCDFSYEYVRINAEYRS